MDENSPDVSVQAQDTPPSTGAEGSSPSQSTVAASPAVSSNDVNQPSDPTQPTTATEPDPLEGVPSLEDLKGKESAPYAKALAQLRQAYEPLSAQHKELSAKYQPFEQFTQTPEELQGAVKLNDSLFRYSPNSQGVLQPDPTEFVQQLSTEDPVRADYLTTELFWGKTTGPDGQPIERAEMILQVIAQDPDWRARALKTLGGVEPSAVPAPTWAPTPEELAVVNPELQDIYRKLPYDKRESLKLNDPDLINEYLEDQKFKVEMRERDARQEAEQRQNYERQQQVFEQEATAAGETFVKAGFQEALTKFANSIYESYQPTDDPIVNRREGAQVALAVAALSHPDLQFIAEAMLQEMGMNPNDLKPFDESRKGYANLGRQHGYLTHKQMRTTGEDPSRAQQRMIAQATNLATKIIAGRNEYFTKKAQSHNNNLDQTERARVPIGGQAQVGSNGSGNRYIDAGKRTEAEIWNR